MTPTITEEDREAGRRHGAQAFPYDSDLAAEAGAAFAEGLAIGRAHAKAHVAAILDLPEAKSRYRSAVILSTETDITIDEARKVLAAMPEDQPADPLAFLRAPAPAPTAKAAQIVAAYEKIAGPLPHRAKPAARRA